ncbi:unnamed protein product [Echinostoma caproni]|uniref:Cadherin domain-containing protein n=1 Tax=Echinostoma caproni TaxID=27848 RepID=A0A3P8BA33_9TREM|nr:unnamed protein product [Echinostoma caproni]
MDREKYPMYELMVRAEDHGVPRLSSTSVVKIHILDVNDNAPRFVFPSSSNNTIYVPRSTKPGTVVAQLYAIDDDTYENGKVLYELQEDRVAQTGSLFALDPQSGHLSLRHSIDEVGTPMLMAQTARNSNRSVSPKQESNRTQSPGTKESLGDSVLLPSAYSLFVNVSHSYLLCTPLNPNFFVKRAKYGSSNLKYCTLRLRVTVELMF